MRILYVADYQSEELIRRRNITMNIHAGGNTKISRIARGLRSRGHAVSILATGIAGRRSGRGFGAFDSFVDGTAIPVHYGESVDIPMLNHAVGAAGMTRWARRNGPWDCLLMYNFGFESVMTCLGAGGSKRIPLVVEYEDDAKISLAGKNRLHRFKGESLIGCLQDRIGGASNHL